MVKGAMKLKRYYYITPEDYKTAEQNGIKVNTVRSRVYRDGWDIDRAITEPPQLLKREFTKEELESMERLGLTKECVTNRIRQRGMTQHEAATTPKEDMANFHRKVFTKEEVAIMESNGIKYSTALYRVRKAGWSVQDAITKPPMNPQENAANARKTLKNVWKRHNDMTFRGKA